MRQQGFTLIEMLVVVMMIGTLTAIALPQYRRAMDRSKVAEAMQMLPAIFEARERWMIEQHNRWNEGFAEDASGNSVTPKFTLLDIESKGTIDSLGITMKTPYFTYTLVDGHNSASAASGVRAKDQPCVSAQVRWGASRGLTAVKLYYRGDKIYCYGGENGAENCDILNVPSSNGCE